MEEGVREVRGGGGGGRKVCMRQCDNDHASGVGFSTLLAPVHALSTLGLTVGIVLP